MSTARTARSTSPSRPRTASNRTRRERNNRPQVKEGETVEAMVINVDRKNRQINLSIKAKDSAEQDSAMKKYSAESAAAASGATNLGALLKAKLDNKGGDQQ